MRNQVALITVAAAAVLFLQPAASVAQGWTSVQVDRRPPVIGNGQIVTQPRPVDRFEAVEARGASEVVVRVGPQRSIAVTGDSNIVGLVTTDVRRGKLVIDTRASYRVRRPVKVMITTPDLTAFGLNGSGNAEVSGIRDGDVALAVSGSGNIRATGRTRNLSVAVNGSGDVNATDLAARTASVAISGSGKANVWVDGPLTTVINGSGNVRYRGQARPVSTISNGSGRVVRLR